LEVLLAMATKPCEWCRVPAPFAEPTFPTPLRRVPELSHDLAEVWLKDDGQTHAVYGGNKVRQVAALVRDAEERGARRVLTFGAAGSHHVLTTTLFARARGLECAALLTPQPGSEHAKSTLRAAIGAGLEAFPARGNLAVPWAFGRAFQAGDVLIAPGGFGARGAAAYADAVGELVTQFDELGEAAPDCIVVPLGTGVTAAGLLAGVTLRGLKTIVVAVAILDNPFARAVVSWLAGAVLARERPELTASRQARDRRELTARGRARLEIERRFVGAGYGAPTEAGERALERAASFGIELDPTYTAKTMACVLELVERARVSGRSRPLRIVYWHTLSAAPLEPLLVEAPAFEELSPALRELVR
jgi:D-cysteine desulfhydrase